MAAPCPQNNFGAPEWAPDGQRLAYIDGYNEQVLYVTDGQYPTLMYAGVLPFDVGWSPDGKKVVLDDSSPIDGTSELFTQTIAGGQHTTLQSNGGIYALEKWSPDGTKIGFTVQGEIYTIQPGGSGLIHITSGGFGSWSPDGRKIAFTRGSAVWVMNADGSGQVQLTSSGSDAYLAWSPDGTKIAFTSSRDGNQEIYTMNADGSAQTNVTNSPEGECCPSWQPLPINYYPRPKGATPFQTYFTVAYKPCTSPNRQHGAPLASDSCSPPVQTSDYLTVGTLDSNGQKANSIGSVRADVKLGNPSTPANEADVRLTISLTDVRNKADLSDYTGEVAVTSTRRITDKDSPQAKSGSISIVTGGTPIGVATAGPHLLRTGDQVAIAGVSGAPCVNGTWTITVTGNGSFTLDGSSGCGNGSGGTWQLVNPPPGAATTADIPLSITVPCTATADTTVGSTCSLATTANTLVPSQVIENVRAIWQLDQVKVYDGGADGQASTTADNTLFMDEGVFVP